MLIQLAHGAKHREQKLSLYLAVHTSKIWRIFVGETEKHLRMIISAFALCARMLVKLTPNFSLGGKEAVEERKLKNTTKQWATMVCAMRPCLKANNNHFKINKIFYTTFKVLK
jgi:hypothetical protein